MRRLPPLIPLRAFEAVGRTGSVRAAAEELCVSHSVISHHLHALQTQLGVKLVKTRGRGIELTPEGAAFQREITRSLNIIAQAMTDLSATGHSMKIWCAPELVSRRMLPRLPELQACMPDLDVVLTPTLTRAALSKGEADVEIAYLDRLPPDPNTAAELLVRPRVFPVASPSFLQRCPEARRLDALAQLPLLHDDTTQRWEHWLEIAQAADPGPLHGVRLSNADLAIEAARLGHGLALANDLLVVRELASGELVETVVSDVRLGAYYIITESSRWLDRNIVLLREWLRDACLEATVGHERRNSPPLLTSVAQP